MNKLTAIRIKNDDNTFSDQIPVSVLAENVQWDNTYNLIDILGAVDVDINGSLQEQINNFIIDTDTTLSINGAPADAKAVGDNIYNLKGLIGTPLIASSVSSMIDTNKIYVYTGLENGYVKGNWYYYDGTKWTNGGIYNSVAVEMDTEPIKGSTKPVTSNGIYQVVSQLKDYTKLKDMLSLKINKPTLDSNGISGQLLRTLGDGNTEWVDVGQPTDEQTSTAVANWLDIHPEATTTVQNKSITISKLSDDIINLINNDSLNVKMFGAVGDGETDDTAAFKAMFAEDSYAYYIPKGNYLVDHSLCIKENLTHNIKIYGDGAALSRIKLKDNSITENSQRLVTLSNNDGNTDAINIEISGLYVDMNRRNNNLGISPGSWDLQYCHAFSIVSRSRLGINAKIQDVEFFDCIADGVSFGGGSGRTFDTIIVDRIVAKGKVQSRSDICITADFNTAIISNCDTDTFEVEVNSYDISLNHRLLVNNCAVNKRFDIGARWWIENNNGEINYLINNCVLTDKIYFSYVNAKFSNCKFYYIEGQSRPLHSKLEFINCDINDDLRDPQIVKTSMFYVDTDNNTKLEFKNCNIRCNNSAYFLYLNTNNIVEDGYDVTFEKCRISGKPLEQHYCRLSNISIYLYGNTFDFDTTRFIYLGAYYNNRNIIIKDNIMLKDHQIIQFSAVDKNNITISIKCKNNHPIDSDHFGLYSININNLTSRRGGSGTILDFIQMDNFQAPNIPTTGNWIKGQKIYNTAPNSEDAIIGWICTKSGNSNTANFTPITF